MQVNYYFQSCVNGYKIRGLHAVHFTNSAKVQCVNVRAAY